MIKLVFVLLNDKSSVNTINILNYLDDNVTILNKKRFMVDFILVDKKVLIQKNLLNLETLIT